MCIPSPCVRINGFSPFFRPLEIGRCSGVRGPPLFGIHACWHFGAADPANRSLCTSVRLANIRCNTPGSSGPWRIIDDLPELSALAVRHVTPPQAHVDQPLHKYCGSGAPSVMIALAQVAIDARNVNCTEFDSTSAMVVVMSVSYK